ncbi:MAG: FtsX-like permease family protein [Conexibacteraceae bacterium]|nr:FtsX-like permease family protein [Conexibacteraceae bacterium]
MLALAVQTVRGRRASLAGAFVAVVIAATLMSACAVLIASALRAPGPGRFAAAELVVQARSSITVGHGNTASSEVVFPAPRLPMADLARAGRVPGVARAVGDVSFPVAMFDAAGTTAAKAPAADNPRGHGWSSAALAGYRLSAGVRPGAADVVVARSLAAPDRLRPRDLVRIATPGGARNFTISGIASGPREDEQSVFFADAVARGLAGAPDQVNAIAIIMRPGTDPARVRAALRHRLGGSVVVLDRAHAAEADAGDPRVAGRSDLIALLGTMAGTAGTVAVFVIASTFAFAVAQRRRENTTLRAIGATPGQVRRMVIAEALLIGLSGGAIGMIAGLPLASWIARMLVSHNAAPQGFVPYDTWIALVCALGAGLLVCLLAVLAAAWRAGAAPPAEALRDQRTGRQRIGLGRGLIGVGLLGGAVAMICLFQGQAALTFSYPTALLFMSGTALLAPLLLGGLSALVARPLRLLPGALGLLASTAVSASRGRGGAVGVPIMLITVLAATGVVLAQTDQRNTQRVATQRTTATQVLVASAGAGLPPATVSAIRTLSGVRGATGVLPTQIFLLDRGLTNNGDPRPAAALDGGADGATPGLDLGVRSGSLAAVHGDVIALAYSVAAPAHLHVGDPLHASMFDLRRVTLRIGAIYDRGAGLGELVVDPALARAHAADRLDSAIFVTGGAAAARQLTRYARLHPEVAIRSRSQYLAGVHGSTVQTVWVAWFIISLAGVFALLSLINTVAMATAVRGREFASIRLLGGTRRQCLQLISLESSITVLVALAIGALIVRLSLLGVPAGPTGMPVSGPSIFVAAILAGTGLLGIIAGTMAGMGALRPSPRL